MENKNELNLTKEEALAVADFLDSALIPFIQDDREIDNMKLLCRITNAFQKLCKYSNYRMGGETSES